MHCVVQDDSGTFDISKELAALIEADEGAEGEGDTPMEAPEGTKLHGAGFRVQPLDRYIVLSHS